MTSSTAVRADLVEALQLDLVGPSNDHPFAWEVLKEAPQHWYLTGFLVPEGDTVESRTDPESNEEDVDAGDAQAIHEGQSDRVPAPKSLLPASIGLTFLVPASSRGVQVSVEWGDYAWIGAKASLTGAEHDEEEILVDDLDAVEPASHADGFPHLPEGTRGFARNPRTETMFVAIPDQEAPASQIVPDSGGLALEVFSRMADGLGLPPGTRSVSVFLVNRRSPTRPVYRAMAFQARLTIEGTQFVPRPDLRGSVAGSTDLDERMGDLHYRDCYEYAAGHGCAADWDTAEGHCSRVWTQWIPAATVERVNASELNVDLSMKALGAIPDGVSAGRLLRPLVRLYGEWIESMAQSARGLNSERLQTASHLVSEAHEARKRLDRGIQLLESDAMLLRAFVVANRAMARSAVQRRPGTPDPQWRPFQLAFLLLNLEGLYDAASRDRRRVDLLFFPTGGGKTEAYLGLAAIALVLRRLRNPEVQLHGVTVPAYAGVTVLMRYTLRLLTLDQLGRAAALMCALELERDDDPDLGHWPFEIGLWVGSAATPNRLGSRGDAPPETALARVRRFKSRDKGDLPIPLKTCPWCGVPFGETSFHLEPNEVAPRNLVITCADGACEFSGDRPLPIVGVDEPVYRRLPAFLLATIDKFAALPWTGEVGALFGKATHFDPQEGFSGSWTTHKKGVLLVKPLLPPELIIQDELHLISGPLGTIAGLYETAIEELCRDGEGNPAKIIASTATVRRANQQIRALFGRAETSIFPPPGIDRRDSFFARTVPVESAPGRLYLGIAAPGRSFKVLQMRVARTLLAGSFALYERHGSARAGKDNPADPYVTLLGYFNSLRELGGFRRIAEDEIHSQLTSYGRRKRRSVAGQPVDSLFVNRRIDPDVLELTSRVSTDAVAETKSRLELEFSQKLGVDLALATNMISVGLDIARLGLMTVHGQPKSSAEYIQSTSRVGRDDRKPGLVVAMLNIHKARDRSHYEHFRSWHESFYRAVEPTSVTPFSPRALDRALVGALVGLARHWSPIMEAPLGAQAITSQRQALQAVRDLFVKRARMHADDPPTTGLGSWVEALQARCDHLLDDWEKIAHGSSNGLQYQRELLGHQRLLFEPLSQDLKNVSARERQFRANRSMRDVEPSVELWVEALK